MQKLSSQKIAQVLEDTRTVLLSVTDERDKLAARCAELETRQEAEKLAFTMHDKGLELDTPIEDLVAGLEKRASEGGLDTIKEAVSMVAPNMGLAASVTDEPRGGGDGSNLMNYVLGGVG
jgi:hypothetical protein